MRRRRGGWTGRGLGARILLAGKDATTMRASLFAMTALMTVLWAAGTGFAQEEPKPEQLKKMYDAALAGETNHLRPGGNGGC